MTDPSRVRICGVLEPFASGFAAELAQQGYLPSTLVHQLHLVGHLSRWLTDQGLQVSDLPTRVECFVEARRTAGFAEYRTPRALRPLLGYLRKLGVVPPPAVPAPTGPVELTLVRYRHHLTAERGLADKTGRLYTDAVRPFLYTLVLPDAGTLDVGHLSGAYVVAYVVAHAPKQSRHAAKLSVTALRSFLRFLHLEGAISHSFAEAVPAVSGWRLTGLPRTPEPSDVSRLLASCDCQTTAGRRNFAILTILSRLGLRAAEVAALGLDDIDWHRGEIVVRGKGARTERLPLPADVGAPIAAYLRQGRPATAQARTVFVRLKAPHGALTGRSVTHMVAAAARRAGLGLMHAHRLRHFAATQTLRNGGSLAEVKQLLRHARAQTTAIYAKVDREALRTIARPWPGGVA